jgi:hypothetical protein
MSTDEARTKLAEALSLALPPYGRTEEASLRNYSSMPEARKQLAESIDALIQAHVRESA